MGATPWVERNGGHCEPGQAESQQKLTGFTHPFDLMGEAVALG
jgi:hypothetical protein